MDVLEKIGNIKFEFVGETQLLDVHIFRADAYNGEPTESDGMTSTAPPLTGKKWKQVVVMWIIIYNNIMRIISPPGVLCIYENQNHLE